MDLGEVKNALKKFSLKIVPCIISLTLIINSCNIGKAVIDNVDYDKLELGSFVESGFPYITTCLDARDIGSNFPDTNVVARGLAIQLGNNAYACFDMDLLRWSVAWTGDFISLTLPAQGSYNNFFKRNNNELPQIAGKPAFATGMYAGWSTGSPVFHEVRDKSQQTEGLYWGPVPSHTGLWKGIYPYGQSAILSYKVSDTDVLELPGSIRKGSSTVFTRTFRVGKSQEKLFLQVAEVKNGHGKNSTRQVSHIFDNNAPDTATSVAVNGAGAAVKLIDSRYLVVELPSSDHEREFSVLIQKGQAKDTAAFQTLANTYHPLIPDFSKGAPQRWTEQVTTKGLISPDTAAFVSDILTLPLPNPWKRNIRVADISFFSGNKAAVSTYEGDIWMVEGINETLDRLSWRRFASGFYEPMSIEVYNGQIFVFGKEGIVRLHDLNRDGEADFYENYSNLMQQSTGTREWAADMTMDREGNFYIAKGGHVTGYKGVLPYLSNIVPKNVYRASTRHSGSVLKISADGTKLEVIATGLRMPYIGLNRNTGFLSASDQQGNFVQATPIYSVSKGDYFGVPVTKHREGELEIANPITWIPHRVDRSGTSQTWIESDKMGLLSRQMVHFSFGRPGIFRVLFDSSAKVMQGGVAFIRASYPAPVLKGEINPGDGQLYAAGFNNYASNSFGVSALIRLRYTGKPDYMLNRFQAGKQGILLSFDSELLEESAKDVTNFTVKRWNYKRTERYGSGHFKPDGSPGEEVLPVLGSYLSADKRSILLLIPDMKKSDQMEVMYTLKANDGKEIKDGFWFSVFDLEEIDFKQKGIPNVDLTKLELTTEQIAALVKSDHPVTVDRGKELFEKVGCIGCHSPGKKTEGMYGPPFQGIFGTKRELEDGSFVLIDEPYLRESILEPSKKVSKGYNAEMPSFEGILSESDIASILFYIKTLY